VPSNVRTLLTAAGLSPTGAVSWGTPIANSANGMPGTGVYVVALTADPDQTQPALATCPLSMQAVQQLLDVRPELTLDGQRPDAAALGARLAGFWCPDEVVLYIGRAGPRRRVTISELSDRVREYYDTRLGARSPHAGGWPLKTLRVLSDLHVHYVYCDNVEGRERQMLSAFADALSQKTRKALYDSTCVMPFANLEDADGRYKLHGIKRARAPRGERANRRSAGRLPEPEFKPPEMPGVPAATAASSTTSDYRTQPVSFGDIERGTLRIPIVGPTKKLFPRERGHVDIDLRGGRKTCRWHPHYDADQERSGVIGVGSALMRRRVTAGEQLRVEARGGTFYLA
jgi:hypothetical protein